jgi:hypothetical protein
MLNVIREYLVSLGYKVDMPSFSQAKGTMKEMERAVASFADSSVVKFAAAGAAVTGFVYAAGKALAQFTVGVANADLQNEMFARRMWMSKDAAVSFQNSLKALGVSLQDLYLSPELMDRFIQLRQQALTMRPPGGFDEAMKGIRSLTFEWQRFKLEASYAVYWVGYYLTKYLAGPMGNLKDRLKNINDTITARMPYWTKNVAQVLSWFVRLGRAAYLAGERIKSFWEGLGKPVKKAVEAAAGFFALLKVVSRIVRMTPFGRLITGLISLLALIDDFYTYKQGGKSAFPGLWEGLQKWIEEMSKEGGAIDRLKKSFADLSAALKNLWDAFKDLFDIKGTFLDWAKVIARALKDLAEILIKSVAFALKEIAGLIDVIAGGAVQFKILLNPNLTPEQKEELKKKSEELRSQGWELLKGGWKELIQDFQDYFSNASPSSFKSSAPAGSPAVSPAAYLQPVSNKELGGVLAAAKEFFQQWKAAFIDFRAHAAVAAAGGRFYGPFAFMYPPYPAQAPAAANVTYSPVYHIYGASQPENVLASAKRIDNRFLMRIQQGVIS